MAFDDASPAAKPRPSFQLVHLAGGQLELSGEKAAPGPLVPVKVALSVQRRSRPIV
jgi:hypothetical protein